MAENEWATGVKKLLLITGDGTHLVGWYLFFLAHLNDASLLSLSKGMWTQSTTWSLFIS